ncbi:hypothetical protein HDV62DRAFT_256058 [Trichoderma sp. SZMC 28011]
MPFKRAGLIQSPASTARLCYGRQLSASSAVRWWPPTDAQAAGSPRNALCFFFFIPSNAKDSLPRRNSEAETLPGAMTLAESRRSPPRWVGWILFSRQTCQTTEPCLDPARCM